MRRMYAQSELEKIIKNYINENGKDWDLTLKSLSATSISVKSINVLSEDGEHYCPIDYDYQDADDHRLVILDNVHIANDLGVENIDVSGSIKGTEIVEQMSGYSYDGTNKNADFTPIYVGVVKNGNKLTCVFFMSLTATTADYLGAPIGILQVPYSLNEKLKTFSLSGIDNLLDVKVVPFYSGYNTKKNVDFILQKYLSAGGVLLQPAIYVTGLTANTTYLFRYEVTFLLSENLASQE